MIELYVYDSGRVMKRKEQKQDNFQFDLQDLDFDFQENEKPNLQPQTPKKGEEEQVWKIDALEKWQEEAMQRLAETTDKSLKGVDWNVLRISKISDASNEQFNKNLQKYKCQLCGKIYRKAQNLKGHMKKWHPPQQNTQNKPASLQGKISQPLGPYYPELNQLFPQSIVDKLPQNTQMTRAQLTKLAQKMTLASKQQADKRMGRRKEDITPSKTYTTRRIYFCGVCHLSFKFSLELSLHLKQNHLHQIPTGTIFGIKKDELLKYFQLYELIVEIERGKPNYKCGCGKAYTCASSLRCHILSYHKGVRPAGTIGPTPRGQRPQYKL